MHSLNESHRSTGRTFNPNTNFSSSFRNISLCGYEPKVIKFLSEWRNTICKSPSGMCLIMRPGKGRKQNFIIAPRKTNPREPFHFQHLYHQNMWSMTTPSLSNSEDMDSRILDSVSALTVLSNFIVCFLVKFNTCFCFNKYNAKISYIIPPNIKIPTFISQTGNLLDKISHILRHPLSFYQSFLRRWDQLIMSQQIMSQQIPEISSEKVLKE